MAGTLPTFTVVPAPCGVSEASTPARQYQARLLRRLTNSAKPLTASNANVGGSGTTSTLYVMTGILWMSAEDSDASDISLSAVEEISYEPGLIVLAANTSSVDIL